MEDKCTEREVVTTIITAGGRAYLPDLGPMPEAEILYAIARHLEMYVAFELNTHVRSFGIESNPVYEPRQPGRICLGLCKTKEEVPLLARAAFHVVNTDREAN